MTGDSILNMKTNKEIKKNINNKGIAIFVAILTASIALAIGASVLSVTIKQLKLSSFGAGSTQALFSADSGLNVRCIGMT